MNIFLVNKDNPCAQSLCEKLHNAKDGEFIQLTTPEFELHDSIDFQHITFGNDGSNNISEVRPGASYIFTCDEKTNFDDVLETQQRLGINISIVRVRS